MFSSIFVCSIKTISNWFALFFSICLSHLRNRFVFLMISLTLVSFLFLNWFIKSFHMAFVCAASYSASDLLEQENACNSCQSENATLNASSQRRGICTHRNRMFFFPCLVFFLFWCWSYVGLVGVHSRWFYEFLINVNIPKQSIRIQSYPNQMLGYVIEAKNSKPNPWNTFSCIHNSAKIVCKNA